MTRINIDWVSTGIFVVAYLFSLIPVVPPRAGNAALALACGAIVAYRFRTAGGVAGVNLAFVAVAGVLGLYYAMRAIQSPGRRRPPPGDGD